MLIIYGYDSKKEIWLELQFKSIKEAKKHNPHLEDFYIQREVLWFDKLFNKQRKKN